MSESEMTLNDYFNDAVATFGDRLEAARSARGLTVEGLAEKLGIRVETVKAWENDADMPRANRVQMLAGLLNVSIVWLISGEGSGAAVDEEAHARPTAINDALGEIGQLRETLQNAIKKIERLETRLRQTED